MGWIINVLAFLVAIFLLVTIHEFGHYWVAKRCGVKILRFSIGFWIPLLRWTNQAGTEFRLGCIPLGGYVKMLDTREETVLPSERMEAFDLKPLSQRFWIVLAGPLANFLCAIFIYTLILMIGFKTLIPVVGNVAPESVAERAGLESGMEIIAINGTPTPSWEEVRIKLIEQIGNRTVFNLETQWKGHRRDFAMSGINVRLLPNVDPIKLFGIQMKMPPIPIVLGSLELGQAAAEAGLKVGDRVLSIEGEKVSDWQQFVEIVQANPLKPLSFLVKRGDLEKSFIVTPSEAGKVGFIGVHLALDAKAMSPYMHKVQLPFFSAVSRGVTKTVDYSLLTLKMIGKMIVGDISVKQLSGPVSIAQGAGHTAQLGFLAFFNFLAFVSISLGVMNCLPIPMLDGGHLLFYGIEWVRGRPLPAEVQEVGVRLGLAALLVFMTIALYNDILRLL